MNLTFNPFFSNLETALQLIDLCALPLRPLMGFQFFTDATFSLVIQFYNLFNDFLSIHSSCFFIKHLNIWFHIISYNLKWLFLLNIYTFSIYDLSWHSITPQGCGIKCIHDNRESAWKENCFALTIVMNQHRRLSNQKLITKTMSCKCPITQLDPLLCQNHVQKITDPKKCRKSSF